MDQRQVDLMNRKFSAMGDMMMLNHKIICRLAEMVLTSDQLKEFGDFIECEFKEMEQEQIKTAEDLERIQEELKQAIAKTEVSE